MGAGEMVGDWKGRWWAGAIRGAIFFGCHPERNEGPMQFANASKLHRSFAAKAAAQDDNRDIESCARDRRTRCRRHR